MKPTILYGVLNWGLGHASRSVPVIRSLSDSGYEVVIASDGDSLKMLRKEFPLLNYEIITGYNVTYPFRSIMLNILLNSFKISRAMFCEYIKLDKMIDKYKPAVIISDNRYGFRSRRTRSVMLCHQMTVYHKNSIISYLANMMNRFLLNRFDEVWIPDFSGNKSLAGKLSDLGFSVEHHYIGPLSRLKKDKHQMEYDIAIVLSGPEPQRTYFEKILIDQLKNCKQKAILVRGVITDREKTKSFNNIDIIDFANTEEMDLILNSSKLLIARSGYSTVMDVASLGIKAVFIPTPGQTEQEYLAQYLKEKGFFYSIEQSRFDLGLVLKESENYDFLFYDNPELPVKIREILKKTN